MLPARLRTFIQGVSVNPPGHRWADDNVVSGAEARRLKDCLSDWCGEAAGGDGEAVELDEMDPEQRFAYRIHDAKMAERAELERQGLLENYRALRMILTGPPGAGKSRTVRAIAALRKQRAREEARLRSLVSGSAREVERRADEAGRGACVLALSLIHISEPTRPY